MRYNRSASSRRGGIERWLSSARTKCAGAVTFPVATSTFDKPSEAIGLDEISRHQLTDIVRVEVTSKAAATKLGTSMTSVIAWQALATLLLLTLLIVLGPSLSLAQNYAVKPSAPAPKAGNATDAEWSCATSDQAVRTIRLCTPKILDPKTSDKRRVRYLMKRAKAWIVEDELWAAVNDYGRVAEIIPTNETVFFERAKLYDRLGEFALAKDDYTHLIAANRENASSYCNRGYTKLQLREYDSAIEDYTAALKVDPNRLDCMVGRGNVYAAKGEDEKALEEYAAAVAANKRFPDAYYQRAKLHERRGEIELAIKNYSAVININRIHMRARKELQALGILPW